MRSILLQDTWESFYIEQRKVGIMRRVTTVGADPSVLVTKLTILYGQARFEHTYAFLNAEGYRSHSYLYDTNDGAPIHAKFDGERMICQVDDDRFVERVSADARPRHGNYPLIVTIPFEVGYRTSYTQIDDASCTQFGKIELVSQGWRTVTVGGQPLRLWRVDEYSQMQLGNRYWLDEQRRVRLSQWRGATSRWVSSRDVAFEGLSAEFATRATAILSGDHNLNWTNDLEKWLHTQRSA